MPGLRLLDPDRFADYQTFLDEEAEFEQVADVIEQLMPMAEDGTEEVPDAAIESLKGLVSAAQLAALQEAEQPQKTATSIINQLLDQHGTGRVLFRNTRQSVTGFPERLLHPYPLPAPDVYLNQTDSRNSLSPETTVADDCDWTEVDPRIHWLVEQCRRLKAEKLLVIASQASTVLKLEGLLREQHGIHAAVFHEGMSLIERDQAAAWFADEDHGTQLLLCSEIGSEGRNFQFAHHLLFFDLPGHPDLLEQRIGRLDRIGQQHSIEIHVPYLNDTAQQRWFEWYDQGLMLFARTNPAAHHVHTAMAERLQQDAADPDWAAIIAESQTLSTTMLEQMNRGRDRLLEYNSCRPEQAAALTASAHQLTQAEALQDYMHQVFDLFGVHHEEHRPGSEIIRPTDEMHGYFPFLLEDGMTITYDREVALANETFHFITWEHPMVTEVMDLLLSQEMGNTGFMVLKDSGLNAGQLFLECRYLIQASGHADMQLSRYLPPVINRVLMAEAGVDVADKLSEKLVERFSGTVPMNVAVEVLKAKLPVIKKQLKAADGLMQKALPALQDEATERLSQRMSAEIRRLEELAAANGQVRQEEIDHLETRQAEAHKSISQIQPQLDSVRILVTM